ncbi:hypothetical protein GCM10023189_14160 [Nibrella saemangeumensis]|uniref:SnoaL-like domain-containing protein n=1 Tax=Nibrella saemangeumensis TaxID=1084526 RepID=A0ABP8MN41_9BACT
MQHSFLLYPAGLVLAGLLTACTPAGPADLETVQQQNIRVVRQLQAGLNQHDWAGVSQLYAERVRYKGPHTRYQEVEQTPGEVVAAYRGYHLEITQLYAAYEHHVVVEGRLSQGSPRPVCMIYTIENGRITRQYTY